MSRAEHSPRTAAPTKVPGGHRVVGIHSAHPFAAALAAFALFALLIAAPASPHDLVMGEEMPPQSAAPQVQTAVFSGQATQPEVTRDSFEITPGRQTFISGGTNYDWAKLVLLSGGWPVTDNNVTVIVRWMRQENYVKSWWNRKNPLNNGWGSGGGSGLGSYSSLVSAAENAAEALNTLAGYAPIREAFAASAATDVTEHAIWASPWASGHYANGAHWHYSEVEVVAAPAGAW